MISILLVVLGTAAFAILDALQKRYLPAFYLEPMDPYYGIDPSLDARRVILRLGFPYLIGVVLAVPAILLKAHASPALIASAATTLGSAMLVYPALRYPIIRGRAGITMAVNTWTFLAYLSFIFLNAVLGLLGATTSDSVLPFFRASAFGVAVSEWVSDQLPGDILSAAFFAVGFALWRLMVRLMQRR